CREEMPMLEAAQQRYPGVTFAFVNHREGRDAIRRFLDNESLQLSHVLIDPQGTVLGSLDTSALPTSLFFDANGRLVDIHRGMMTSSGLATTLKRLHLIAAQTAADNRG